MTRDGLRVLLPAIASIVAIAAAAFALEWFIVDINGTVDLSKITIDLREAHACTAAGECASVPMSMIKGSAFPTLATISFWGALMFALIVLYQVGTRVLGGTTSDSMIKAGHGIGSLVVLTTVAAAYLLGPDLDPMQTSFMGIDFDRGWGPLAMLVGLSAGQVALYFLKDPNADDVPIIPVTKQPPLERPAVAAALPRAVATTRVPLPLDTPPEGSPAVKPRAQTRPPYVSRTQTPTRPPELRALADVFKGKVKFAMVTGDVTMGGIDARREDGKSVLVMWRDVVGIVVRRLPPELDGHPFIDIVSTAGMTLRVLPWSKLTGEHFEGDGDTRVRSFMQIVTKRCTEARIDRATQSFLDDDTKRPAQLPSLDLLAKHDTALA